MRKNLPREDFHVLFNVARLGIRKAHDDLEEFFAVRLSFRDSQRTEAFEIAPNAILLLHREPNANKRLE